MVKESYEKSFEQPDRPSQNSVIELVNKYRQHWHWFLLCGLLGLSIAYLKLRYSTPVYKIQAKILVVDAKSNGSGASGPGSFEGDLGALLGGPSSVDNEAEILKTRYIMERVVKDDNEQVTVFQPGTVRDMETYPSPVEMLLLSSHDSIAGGIFSLEILDGKRGRITQGEGFSAVFDFGERIELPRVGFVTIAPADSIDLPSGQFFKIKIAAFDNRVSNFMGRLGVNIQSNLASVIDLSFDYPLRKKGEQILNKLIQVYIENNIINKNTIADSTIAFIDKRLALVATELYDIEQEIEDFRQSRNLANMSSQAQILLENTRDYVNQLADIQTQLSILENVESYLVDENKPRVLPNAVLADDVVFTSLIRSYNELLLERGRRLLSATPDNPTVINLDRQLGALRQDMLSNLRSTGSRLRITKENLERKTAQLETEIKDVPATERVYLDLSRQQQIKHELYVYLLQKREETAISKTASVSNSRVIDPPKAASSPFSPKRAPTLLAGLLIGLIVPSALIYFRDLLNTKVRAIDDIKRQTSTPVIGEIIRSRYKETLVVGEHSRSAISEQFRSLRTNLAFYLTEPNQKTVLLTSSMSGEGKSFVALNLATILAITGKRVVLMEMDLRKPNISVKLANSNETGFTNYVINTRLTPKEILRPSGIQDNLFVIGSGPVPPNPAETILHPRLDELMQYLKNRFDYIIIDAPPIGLVTDAQLLSQFADLTLYLVRLGYTYKNQLQIVDELLRNRKMKQLALLVNDIDPRGGHTYGYGSGYGYGYYDEGEKHPWWKFWTNT